MSLRKDPDLRHGDLVGGAAECVLTRAQQGSAGAFVEFYDEYFPGLLRWFQVRTAAADVAADLCAETFASALASLPRFDAQLGSPGAWLYGIAKNELRTWNRRRRVDNSARTKLGVRLEPPHADELDLVDVRVDLEAMIGPLHTALGGLSRDTRRVLELRIVEQRPYSQIAQIMGCKENAARVRVSRALSALLETLDGGEIR